MCSISLHPSTYMIFTKPSFFITEINIRLCFLLALSTLLHNNTPIDRLLNISEIGKIVDIILIKYVRFWLYCSPGLFLLLRHIVSLLDILTSGPVMFNIGIILKRFTSFHIILWPVKILHTTIFALHRYFHRVLSSNTICSFNFILSSSSAFLIYVSHTDTGL